jgi:tetratricopeptide (TPR) repeat protein
MNAKEKILINKGIDCFRRGNLDDALKYYDRVLQSDPKNVLAWNNRGVTLFKLDRIEEALEAYEKALEIDPTNLDAIRNKGFVFRYQGKFLEAMDQYGLALSFGGDVGDMEGMAISLVGMGKLEEALNVMIEAANTKPMSRLQEEVEAIREAIRRNSESEQKSKSEEKSDEANSESQGQ